MEWLLTGDYLGGEGDVRLGCGLRHGDKLTVRSVEYYKLYPGYLYSVLVNTTANLL